MYFSGWVKLGHQILIRFAMSTSITHWVRYILLQSHLLGLIKQPLSSLSPKHLNSLVPSTVGIVSVTKDKDLDKVNSLCLQASITLDHSIFSYNLTIPFDISPHDWIINSGATDHMIHSISLLTRITSVTLILVKLPNGESVLVTHIGQVKLSNDLVLDNV